MPRVRHDGRSVCFRCPGCGDEHRIPVVGQGWTWNGSVDRPTLLPSLLVSSGHYASQWKQGDSCWCGTDYPFNCFRCHSFITDGQIAFLGDSTHVLAGKTVDLAETE